MKISCICPTYNRPDFLKHSIFLFMNQTYKNKELIIVDDSQKKMNYPFPKNVKYIYLSKRTSIGKKRNIAIENSSGDLIAFWDDDDYYSPSRLHKQAIHFVNKIPKFVLFKECMYFNTKTNELVKVSKEKQKRIWTLDNKGTLVTAMMFPKSIFNMGVRFEHINLAEDQLFIEKSVKLLKAKIKRIDNDMLFVYYKHGNNTYKFNL